MLRLLAHEARMGRFLEPKPGADVASETVPERIGGYRILEVLGRGGMGVVYLAEQESPRRTVALKVMVPAGLAPQAARRFARETQVLARLQHPGIAQIFEAGTDASRGDPRPWFAMELVDGVPIDDHTRRAGSSTREILELYLKVCDAVQHAHEKGVVHRDLKPANVLVDAQGQPKVLDFGVARATDADLQLTTLQTEAGVLVGTLPYMSPEQLAGDSRAIDARSDVYSLGILLFELLTGGLPYSIEGTTVPRAVRILSEEEPTRLSSVRKAFRGDLDTIVSKAIEKDAARRYASAEAIADDVRRFLSDEPIEARPPSTVYQVKKFARRNRALVSGLAIAFGVLVLGVVGTTWQAVLAGRGQVRAEKEANRARRVRNFLLDTVNAADPDFARGRDTSVLQEMMDRASARADAELGDDPEVQAELLHAIGRVEWSLGQLPKAEPLLRRALLLRREILGPASPDALETANSLAHVLKLSDRLDEAEAILRECLAAQEAAEKPSGEALGKTRNDLGEIELARAALAASAEERRRLWEAADDELRHALELEREALGARDIEVGRTLMNRGTVAVSLGRLEEAEEILVEALGIVRERNGDSSRAAATALFQMGNVSDKLGRDEEAVDRWTESLAIYRKLLGPTHAAIASNLRILGRFENDHGRFAGAEAHFREAAEMNRALATTPIDTADAEFGLARAVEGQGRLREAAEGYDRAAALYAQGLREDHAWVASALSEEGRVLLDGGDASGAEPLLRRAVLILKASGKDGTARLPSSLCHHAESLLGVGKQEEALAAADEAASAVRSAYAEGDPNGKALLARLAASLERAGESDAAGRVKDAKRE